MKNKVLKSFLFIALLTLTIGACKDRNAEKRIAELESELAKAKGQKEPQVIQGTQTQEPEPETKPEGPLPEFRFATTKHDFGTLKEGDPAEFVYSFKNSGQAPLVISAVRPSCGCTVPEYSKEPIPVNGSGFVKVKFDTNGKSSVQNKTVTVVANTFPKETILTFTAMIVPKGDAAK